jgi:Zn-dependent peptidase ImmA (M78 family)
MDDSNDGYYEGLKKLARQKREFYQVSTVKFGLAQVRKIYKAEGIRIDQRPLTRRIKAIYMCDGGDPSVAIQETLPKAPKLFALVHELKHHYRDQDAIQSGQIICGDHNANALIEKGAEVFAAEFIYPEEEFAADLMALGVKRWTPEDLVRFKRGCQAWISYTFIRKRMERLNLIPRGAFSEVKFQNLEEQLYGVPFYRRFKRSA